MNSVWIITREENQYDQYGEYFCCAFKEKPTYAQCLEFLINERFVDQSQSKKYKEMLVEHLMSGGGRYSDSFDTWYWLREEKLI